MLAPMATRIEELNQVHEPKSSQKTIKRPIARPTHACFAPSGCPTEVNGSELPFRLLVRRANQGAVQSPVCVGGVKEVR